jgi:hypothetical protein
MYSCAYDILCLSSGIAGKPPPTIRNKETYEEGI